MGEEEREGEKERKGGMKGGRGEGQEGERDRMVYVLWREAHLKR